MRFLRDVNFSRVKEPWGQSEWLFTTEKICYEFRIYQFRTKSSRHSQVFYFMNRRRKIRNSDFIFTSFYIWMVYTISLQSSKYKTYKDSGNVEQGSKTWSTGIVSQSLLERLNFYCIRWLAAAHELTRSRVLRNKNGCVG